MITKGRVLGAGAVVVIAALASVITGVVASASSSVASPAPPPWIEVATHSGALTLHDHNTIGLLATVKLSKGNYLVSAKTEFQNNATATERLGCWLTQGNTIIDAADADVPSVPGSLSEETITLMGAMKFGTTGTVSLQCATTDTHVTGFAYNTVITAIRAGTLVTKALTIP